MSKLIGEIKNKLHKKQLNSKKLNESVKIRFNKEIVFSFNH